MQKDFHYFATCCAAMLAGWSVDESLEIATCAQMVDLCSATFLAKVKGPKSAVTTQLQLELMQARTDLVGLQDITRIWASFHFLPGDLTAEPPRKTGLRYQQKYRLICQPNGPLVKDTVELAGGKGTAAAGLAMHVLADTWAHRNFAGTPSLVINNTNYYFYEILNGNDRMVNFRHSPGAPDDLVMGVFSNSVYQDNENSIMNLGHGRAGHLPDYSFIRYRYLPAWADYDEVIKDNPAEYWQAFCQMVYALQYLREKADASGDGEPGDFETGVYAYETVKLLEDDIRTILEKRQTDACADWQALGGELAEREIPDFDLESLENEYLSAAPEEKDGTLLGAFFLAALAQKSMVTNKIFRSGNLLAGWSVDFREKGFRGIKDFRKLVEAARKEGKS